MFIRDRKLNISHVFITQSYSKVPKDVRLNTTHFFIAKIPIKSERQQIAANHSSNIKTTDFINIILYIVYIYCTAKPSFLVNDTTFASDDPLRCREIIFKDIINNDD